MPMAAAIDVAITAIGAAIVALCAVIAAEFNTPAFNLGVSTTTLRYDVSY